MAFKAYDNADNKFRYYVDNGYSLDGNWFVLAQTPTLITPPFFLPTSS